MRFLPYLLIVVLLGSCTRQKQPMYDTGFTLMKAAETNISFSNNITESDSINVFTNEYMYNGSGVGIGDFNNDGLPDVFFCGSMVSSTLYLNKGNFVFEDITLPAGVQTTNWCTGVSIADVNSDGFDDIYVCASHSTDPAKRKNLLFINDGGELVHFTEQAAAYGLADTGYATQAAFFDYDKDGDLDMYLLNHRLYSHTANNLQPKDTSGHSPAADKLYRNDGIPEAQIHPVFHEVSLQAGIKEDGYGLGMVVTDANNDGWPDIYVANDYIANDLLWLNNKNGTFSNIIAASLRHQSYNSMGVDAADINNDLLPDLAVTDMLPESNERKKMMSAATNQEKFDMQQRFGYEPSYVRNMLQLNNGNRMVNNTSQPYYSEIGQLAGMFETDWSWSVLMADFDNDGWKDMHITNGLGKDVTNNDYNAFANQQAQTSSYTFGSNRSEKQLDEKTIQTLRTNIDKYGSVKMNSYLFHNNGNLRFSDVSKQAGIAMPAISNGAAYADLDNDGDLDLVVNNLNEQAFVYRNETRKTVTDSTRNFISIQLKGLPGNGSGLGCRVVLFNKASRQLLEQSPVRGFSSSVDSRLHFGIGSASAVDSIQIQWPDDKVQLLQHVKANQFITVRYAGASNLLTRDNQPAGAHAIFTQTDDSNGIDFIHTETQNFDFGYHQPLPQKYSQLGPCLATADINGDGLADFFVGGAANQSGQIYIQHTDGRFHAKKLVAGIKMEEDAGAVFFDANGDHYPDLLMTGGSFEFAIPKYNQPRLYINDGTGNFSLDANALPVITDITKAVVSADYDGDGDADLFIGGRLLPGKYPQSPRSYILQNNKGKFTDVTNEICPALQFAGMLTAAIFTDFNNDTKPDLIVCGEWTTIRFFRNENSKLVETTNETGLKNMSGLWRSLQQADIDDDGDMDFIAGNTGLNNRYHIAADRPMMLYAKDIDKNGFLKLVPAYYAKDGDNNYQLFPAPDRNQLAAQVPSVKKKYLLSKDYSTVTMPQLLDYFGASGWTILDCKTMASVWIENTGNGKFVPHALPVEAQFAPINSIAASDMDGDGKADLLVAGNEYQADAATGRYDASYGLFLKGHGNGNFEPVHAAKSGILLDGDIKDMKLISLQNKTQLLLVAPNDNKLQTFALNRLQKQQLIGAVVK